MIEAALFDFGGVYTQSPFRVAESLGSDLGAEPGRLLEIVFGPYQEDTDHPWHRLERGELTLEQARQEILVLGEREGIEADPYQLFARMGGERVARQPMVEMTRRLQESGFQTALVTNNAREFRDAWRSMLPGDELFDVVIDSSEVGLRKPNPEIFLLTLQRLGGIAPEQAVFIDDFEGNLRAAAALGMLTVRVDNDPTEALAKLEALLDR